MPTPPEVREMIHDLQDDMTLLCEHISRFHKKWEKVLSSEDGEVGWHKEIFLQVAKSLLGEIG